MIRRPPLRVGVPYTVAGEGELLFVKKLNEDNILMLSHGHGEVVIPNTWIVREATATVIRERHAQFVVRGVGCRARDCWCRSYLGETQ